MGVILLFLTAAHVLFYHFSFNRLNNYAVSQGMTAGCIIWTTVLFVAMWLRFAWSRYVMVATICLAMVGFSIVALLVRSESVDALPELMRFVIGGLFLYALALIPLGASGSLRHYLGPRTAGDR